MDEVMQSLSRDEFGDATAAEQLVVGGAPDGYYGVVPTLPSY